MRLLVKVALLFCLVELALADRGRIVILNSDGSESSANSDVASSPINNNNNNLEEAADRMFRLASQHASSAAVAAAAASAPSPSASHTFRFTAADANANADAAGDSAAASSASSAAASALPANMLSPSNPAVVTAVGNATQIRTVYTPAESGFKPPCDLTAERGICLFGAQKIIVPDATSKGLVGWYKFDEAHPLDSSRRQHHGVSVIPVGPGRSGFGSSARFDGETWFEVPTNDDFATMLKESSVSFWVFFPKNLEDKYDYDCPIIYVGRDFDTIFSVSFNPETRQLSANRIRSWVSLRTRARLLHSMWYHVALTAGTDSVKLYVNGILEAQMDMPPQLQVSQVINLPSFQFYAGAVPWAPRPQCSIPLLIDDTRLYNRVITSAEIAAESFPSLGTTEPGFVIFGCESCVFDDARKSCPPHYHLCYKSELLAGALTTARKMGWVSPAAKFWENDITNENPTHQGPVTETKAALCCTEQ